MNIDNTNRAPLNAEVASSYEGGASYPLGHRVYRTLWSITWLFFCRFTPPPMHFWRRSILRLFGAKIAKTAHIYGSARVWYPRNLIMKEFSTLARNVNCYNMELVTIGVHGIVSQGAFLCGGSHDVDDPYFQLKVAPIVIGDYAWVAAEAFIGPGVTLGNGAVVGARGVVFRDVESWQVWGGNPAVFLRKRTEREG